MEKDLTPTIGMGCTYSIGGDAYPATIIEVSPSGHRIKIQMDKAVVTSSKGMGQEVYEITRDTDGRIEEYTRRKKGNYKEKGHFVGHLTIGKRYARRDPHL